MAENNGATNKAVPGAPHGEANSWREIMRLNLCGRNIAESEMKNRWFHGIRPLHAQSYGISHENTADYTSASWGD